jgi:Tfp pilus assembly protein PilN
MRAVNLIPADSRSGGARAGRSGGGAYAVLVVLAGLAVLALLYGKAHHQVTSRRAEAASLSARAQSASAAADQLAPYTTFAALHEQREHAVSELVDARFDWAHAFQEISRVLPRDASIGSLEGTVGSTSAGSSTSSSSASSTATAPASSAATASAASTATSSTPPGSVPTFTLTGCATSQQEVALTLQRLRLIDGVSNVTLQSSTESAAGGSASSGAGKCSPEVPAFTVQVAFEPLPSSSTISSTTQLTSQTGAGR